MPKSLLYILFFLSGISALIYEVTWVRKLSLVFGTDTYAVSTTVAVFFLGLSLGSWLFKNAEKARISFLRIDGNRPLALYGLLEIGIGVYAAATPFIFEVIKNVQTTLWRSLSPSFGTFNLITLGLSLVTLLIPTVLMGATLPVVVAAAKASGRYELSKASGLFYGVNTLGAVVGTLTAGFWLIAAWGVNQTIWLAAGVSVLTGLVTLKLAGKWPRIKEQFTEEKKQRLAKGRTVRSVILAAYTVAGLAAISLEVIWTRVLTLTIGGSTYAFSLVLVTFLIGIAAGSLFAAKFTSRLRRPLLFFCLIEIGLGFAVILITPVFGNLPYWFLGVFERFGSSFTNLQVGLGLLAVGVMFIPTLLMGAAFPIVVRALESEKQAPYQPPEGGVGSLYAVNTLGGVAGALLAGFVVIPQIGLLKGVYFAGVSYIFIGIIILAFSEVKNTWIFTCGVLLAMFVVASPHLILVDETFLTAGLYVNPEVNLGKSQAELRRLNAQDKILYAAEGVSAHVAVRKERDGHLNLRINGKADASTSYDMENQVLLGQLPLLLHPNPQEVLVIGLGSGITLGSVLTHPVKQVDVVEIEQKVVEAARYFDEFSDSALSDSRVKVTVADGRNFLLGSRKKYNVISSEPSNPWLSGSSKLFTKEYFTLLQQSLADDGIALHWVNMYAIGIRGLQSVIAAFLAVFPEGAAFGIPVSNDLLLVGAGKDIEVDVEQLEQKMSPEKIKRNLAKAGIEEPWEIIARYYLDRQALEQISSGMPANTDNHPFLEFSAPTRLYFDVSQNPWAVLLTHLSPVDQLVRGDGYEVILHKADEYRTERIRTRIATIEGRFDQAIVHGERALAIDPGNPYLRESLARAYFEIGATHLNKGLFNQAVTSFQKSLEYKATSETYVNIGLSFEGAGDLNKAILAYENALEIEPESIEALVGLAKLYSLRSDFTKARLYMDTARELKPDLKEMPE